MPVGSSRLISAMTSRVAEEIAMGVSSPTRRTKISRAGSPLKVASTSASLKPSCTSAMSRRRSTVPEVVVTSGRSANWLASSRRSWVRSSTSPASVLTSPPGSSSAAWRMRLATPGRERS